MPDDVVWTHYPGFMRGRAMLETKGYALGGGFDGYAMRRPGEDVRAWVFEMEDGQWLPFVRVRSADQRWLPCAAAPTLDEAKAVAFAFVRMEGLI